MSFIKFGEWVSLREEVAGQAPAAPAGAMVPKPAGVKKPNPKTKKIIGDAAKSGNAQKAIDAAVNDPGLDDNDVANVAKAVELLKKN